MHELAVTRSILDEIRRVAARESLRPTRARISIGELTTYKPEPIRYYTRLLTEADELLSGLELDVGVEKGRIRCNDCEAEGLPASELALACARCASFNVEILSGNDVVIEKVSGDV